MNGPAINTQAYGIVIMSCDSYQDVWPYFSKCWHKFWPTCPVETYLISETVPFDDDKIQNIMIGRKVCWSDMLIEVLNQLPHEHIIYMQEDYLLKSRVDNLDLMNKLNLYEQKNAAYLRLFPWPNPDKLLEDNDEIGILEKGAAYRTSLQCAVWNVKALKEILVPGESGWDFESNSVARSSSIKRPFLSVYHQIEFANLNKNKHVIDYFASGILHGKWMRECLSCFKAKGIVIKPGKRGILSRWDYFYYQYKKINRGSLFELINRWVFSTKFFNSIHYYYLLLTKKV